MGIFNNVNKFTNIDISQYTKNVSEIIQANRGFETDKTKMKMLVPLNMNNQRILNSPDIATNNFVYNKGRIM